MCPFPLPQHCSFQSFNSIPVASAPTDLVATQAGAMSLLVSWKPPNPLGDTTGYTMYYTALLGAISGSIDISGGSTSNYTLTDLLAGLSYDISIVGTSQHLPSDVVYECKDPTAYGMLFLKLSSKIYMLAYVLIYSSTNCV